MTANRPSSKGYQPTSQFAAQWLDLARNQARKKDGPFRGRGNLDSLNTAINKGLITVDEVELVFAGCKSVSPSEISNVFNKLWALNGQRHFPLVPLETDDKLIVPPSLSVVLEEYLSQIDYVAKAFQNFLPDEQRKGFSHRDGERLSLVYNPGVRVSPDEYDHWTSQWMENGPPKEWWHREIAISVKLPDVQSVFQRWNQTLANPRRLTPNGVELIVVKADPKKYADRLRALAKTSQVKKSVSSEPLDKDLVAYPSFNLEELLATAATLFDAQLPVISNRSNANSVFAAKIVSRLADQILASRREMNFDDLSDKEIAQKAKQIKRERSIRESLQTQWTVSFAALNDIAEDMFGRNLDGLHAKIIDDLALRSLALISEIRLTHGARDLLKELRPQIPTGPVSRPVFDR